MTKDVIAGLSRAGYYARREEVLAVQAALATRRLPGGGARAILVTGAPGCGKTALAEATAEAVGGRLVFAQLHAWSGDEDLFRGVDVGAAVAGDSEHVHQDGVLAVAARLSHEAGEDGLIIVCLDEIDKAPERVEALLLDWLQTGRVPVRPGEHLSTRLDRVLVFLTSNGARPLSDAFLRRVSRVQMRPLPTDLVVRLIAERAQAPVGVCRLVWRAMTEVSAADETTLSLQEGVRCVADAMAVAASIHDLRLVVQAWAARQDEGRAEARRVDLAPAWGEIVAHRRRG